MGWQHWWRGGSGTIEAVRDSFPVFAETLGHVRGNGRGRWIMSCPLPGHADANPSFAIFASRSGGYLAKCSCGWTGDVIKLTGEIHPGMSFPETVRHIAEAVGIDIELVPADSPQAAQRAVKRPPAAPMLPPLPDLPADFEARHRRARARLYESPELLQRAADQLSVTPGIIQSLTYTSDGLGWEAGRLVYLYEHGVKVRNIEGQESRVYW